ALDAGIVEEAVDLAVGIKRGFHIAQHLGRFGDVGGTEPGIAALLPDDAGRRLAAGNVAVDDDDFGAALGKGERRRPTDPVAGAGDQRDLVGEIQWHAFLLRFPPSPPRKRGSRGKRWSGRPGFPLTREWRELTSSRSAGPSGRARPSYRG